MYTAILLQYPSNNISHITQLKIIYQICENKVCKVCKYDEHILQIFMKKIAELTIYPTVLGI